MSFTLIASQTAAGSPTSITFSSIPQIYKSLLLNVRARGSDAATTSNLTLQFNGDTAANYARQMLYTFNGGTKDSQTGRSITSAAPSVISGNTAPATESGGTTLLIPNYTSTVFHKYVSGIWGLPGGEGFGLASWYPASPAAITSILFKMDSGVAFINGSTFSLYGIS